MSARVSERTESKIQFIDTARELVAHTWRYIHKFPKSTRFIFQTKLSDLIEEVHELIIKGNSVYLRKDNQNDKELRRDYFIKALGALNSFESLLSIVQMVYKQDVSDYAWAHWGELINTERVLLTALLNKLN